MARLSRLSRFLIAVALATLSAPAAPVRAHAEKLGVVATFSIIGDFARHYGIFEGCGTQMPFGAGESASAGGACC